MKLTSKKILEGLQETYRPPWIAIPELRMGTGFKGGRHKDGDVERKIDLFVFNPYESGKLARAAFEIKVSKSDFYKEISDPLKRRSAFRFSNQFYFVTPKDLISPDKIPEDCGLLEAVWVQNPGYTAFQTTVCAPWHDNAPTWKFLASVMRTLTKSERRAK
jgi:hypothetical protein